MCGEEEVQPSEIPLFIDDVTELQKQQELIESQERILHALKAQMETYITDHYGIDLSDDWLLDLVEGVLRHA
jgi:hypothetical protein